MRSIKETLINLSKQTSSTINHWMDEENRVSEMREQLPGHPQAEIESLKGDRKEPTEKK